MNKPLVFSAIAVFFLIVCQPAIAQQSDLKAIHLRTEYKINPVTDQVNPRLSWELQSAIRNQVQKAYQIIVASSSGTCNKSGVETIQLC